MKGEITPEFAELGNQQAAEAFSERFIAADRLAFVDSTSTDKTPVTGYPVGLMHAFIEQPTIEGIRRMSVYDPSGRGLEPDFPKIFADNYEQTFKQLHAVMTELAEDHPDRLNWMMQFAIEKAQEQGLLTVACFTLTQAFDGSYHPEIGIPSKLMYDLPFQNREELMQLRNAGQAIGMDIFSLMDEEAAEIFRGTLQMDPRARNMSFFAGALVMPEAAAVRESIYAEYGYEEAVEPVETDPYEGLSRTERRKREAKDRRRAARQQRQARQGQEEA